MNAAARVVDSEDAKASEANEFPMFVAPKASDNADILDPEFPGEGTGKTQMHDKMIEGGIVSAPAVHITEDEYMLMAQEEMENVNRYGRLTRSQLERLEDAGGEDDELEELRRRRLEELQRRREEFLAAEKYGFVQEVDERSFGREVKDASAKSPVVMLMWHDGHMDSAKMRLIIRQLAEKHRRVKFCSFLVRESGLVEGFPLQHCPTVMCYREGQVIKQFVTLRAFDGQSTSLGVVEWELAELKLLETDLTEDPRILRQLGVRQKDMAKYTNSLELGSGSDDDGDDDSGDDKDSDSGGWGPRKGGFVSSRR